MTTTNQIGPRTHSPRRTSMYGTQHLVSEVAAFLDGTEQDLHDDRPTLIAEPDGDQLVVDALFGNGDTRRFLVNITELPEQPAGPSRHVRRIRSVGQTEGGAR